MSKFTKKNKDGNYSVMVSDIGAYSAYYDTELPCAIGDTVYEIMREDDGLTVGPRTMKTLTNIVSLMEGGRWGKTIFTDKAMAYEACEKMKQENKGICSAAVIAKYIINKCTLDDHLIEQITLQNLLYLCQRQHLQNYGKPLFYEDFYAYGIGPSIPSVYYTYSGYGAAMIASTYPESEMLLSEETMECIDAVVEKYRDCKPWEFECFVRRNGGAWESTIQFKGLHQIIPINEIAADCPMQKDSDDLER